jgi:tetratricopeptide (TPR) repeat protein
VVSVTAFLFCVLGLAQEKPKTLVETGIDYYKAGKYPEAINTLKEVIRTSIDDRDLLRAYVYLGYTYFSLQEMDSAKVQVEKAVEVNPDYYLSEDEFVPDFIAYYKKTKEGLTGIAFFESQPPQASIFLDDKQLGLSPLKKELLAKVYLLRVVKWGFTPYEMELAIKKTEVNNFKIDLNAGKNWKTFVRSSVIFIVLNYLLKSI